MPSRWKYLSLGWKTATLPRVPGVYAIYLDGALVYIGSSWSLAERFTGHVFDRGDDDNWVTPWGTCRVLTIKYKRSKRHGDWLMDEWRLITRLKPVGNIRGTRSKRAVRL